MKKTLACGIAVLVVLLGMPMLAAVFIVSGSAAAAEAVRCTAVAMPATGEWRPPFQQAYTVGSRGFGQQYHPIYHEWRMHNGQDMAAPEGTQIFAACNGAVIFTGMSGGAGNLTAIDCGGGVQTRYMHQSRITVNVGQPVKAGDPIGLVGNTGASTGAHLHFEVVIGGTAVDPVPFMARQGITL